jgi:hypothetical protein
VNLILSPQGLNEYTDQAKTNEILFTHLLICFAEVICRRAAVFIILSLSHSCLNWDQQNFERKFGIGYDIFNIRYILGFQTHKY